MKKTLLLTKEYYPWRGGIANYCYGLFKHFSSDDYLVVTDNMEVKNSDSVINLKLDWSPIKPSWLPIVFKLKSIIKKYQIEQIVTPNIFPLGVLANFLKVPYFISLHGLDINLALRNKSKVSKKILMESQGIIVNSLSTKESLDTLGLDKAKIHLIYPSLDFDSTYDPVKLAAWRKKLALGDDDKVILTVGRLVKRKGQDLVIRAVDHLRSDFSLKYFIVGQGPNKDYLESLIKEKHLENNVFIKDNIDSEDLIYFYRLANIFVMSHRDDPIDVEGFGIVFLEAASLSLPIIAGSSGGAKEIFKHRQNALLVERDSICQLARYIKELLNNPSLAKRLGQSAYKRSQDFKGTSEQSKILKNILS